MTGRRTPLVEYINSVHKASDPDTPSEILEERARFIEFLWYHEDVPERLLIRAINLICHPENWEDWKSRGGNGV